MLKWLFAEPTPDEALIAELKEAVARVAQLGEEARSRGITVWVKTGRWRKSEFFQACNLTWDEAFRSSILPCGARLAIVSEEKPHLE